eukprot:scaffold23995_cov18-Tisochrysis_lutea.AAC.1
MPVGFGLSSLFSAVTFSVDQFHCSVQGCDSWQIIILSKDHEHSAQSARLWLLSNHGQPITPLTSSFSTYRLLQILIDKQTHAQEKLGTLAHRQQALCFVTLCTHACLPKFTQVEILGSKGVVLNMTASWLTMDDERKYNKEAVEALLRGRLLALTELDSHLAKVRGC